MVRIILFSLMLCCTLPIKAQGGDRYLELTHDTLSYEVLGANFMRTYFSSRPQAFFLNRNTWDGSWAWEVVKTGSRSYSFNAMKGRNLFATRSGEGMGAETYQSPTDAEVYTLLGRLFSRALLLAEDTDGHGIGLDGNTYYFSSADSLGVVRTALKWSPDSGSLSRKLADLGDSIFRRIVWKETNRSTTKHEIEALLRLLEREPINNLRNPVYRGMWNTGLQADGATRLSQAPMLPGYEKVEDYFYDQMVYPPQMLAENRGGYAVCQFAIDTLGMTKHLFTLESSEPACEQEVIRLINSMEHWLPARDEEGKRTACMYAVYVSFRPQRYYSRLKAEKACEEWSKHAFVNPETPAAYPGGMTACMQYLQANTRYPESYKGSGMKVRVICRFTIDDYGEIRNAEVVKGSGIEDFDREALRVIRRMPRWTPAVHHHPRPHFQESLYTLSVLFADSAKRITCESKWN